MTKRTVAVVHHYSIQGLGGCESPGSFACCVKFPCYLMLLYTAADQRSRIDYQQDHQDLAWMGI
jgi:hypothetical protein